MLGGGGLDPNDTGDGSGEEQGGTGGGTGGGSSGGGEPQGGGGEETGAGAPISSTTATTVGVRITTLTARIAQLEEELEEAQRTVTAGERRRLIESALQDAGTLDVDTAALLLERAMAGGEVTDVGELVRGLRRGKPHLFRMTGVPGGGQAAAMDGPGDALLEAAAMAAEAGDRGSLLRYLRMRRLG